MRPLHQDLPTRWGSTKTAFESFLDYKDKNDEESNVFSEEVDSFKNADAINNALIGITMRPTEIISDFLLTKREMLKIKNVTRF